MSEQDNILNFSYSKLATFLDCPKKYELQYIKNLVEFKENIYTAFGEAVHKAIEITINKKYDFDEALIIFEKTLKERTKLIDPREMQLIFLSEWYRKGEQLLKYFFDKFYNKIKNGDIEVIATEKYFKYEIMPNTNYNGIIDFLIKEYEDIEEIINFPEVKILKNGKKKNIIKKIVNKKKVEKYKILDWKTGNIQHNENLQLLSYAIPMFFNDNILIQQIQYVYLKHKKIIKKDIDLEVINKTKQKIISIINNIKYSTENQIFDMCLDNSKCKYCNVKKYCDLDFESDLDSNNSI